MAVYRALGGQRVWWVAPTYLMALHPWLTFKRRLADEWVSKTEYARHIELESGGSLTVKTADNPDGLRGVGLDFIVVDEAAFILEEVWTASLRPALSDRQGSALLISTPHGRNWFYRAFQRGLDPLVPDWHSWRYPTLNNPLIRPQEIEDARALLPERIFKQEYEAEFLPDGGEVFRRVREAATAPPDAHPISGHRYVMGVDFGRAHDFTALVVIDADTRTMVALDRFNEVNWGLQRRRIAALARRWRVSDILAEANAMGEPNIEALRRAGLPVVAFTTTSTSKPPLIESLVLAIENADLRILPDPVLLAELEAYTYSVMPYSGRVRYQAPPGQHDDTVIALALAWRLASTPGLTLAVAEI